MGLVSKDDRWRMLDELWQQMEPLLPPRPPYPLGGASRHDMKLTQAALAGTVVERPVPTPEAAQGL